MSYTHSIVQTLREYNENLYKMLEIRIKSDSPDEQFRHGALPPNISVMDGTHMATSFITLISENRKELIGYFTVDAFSSFSGTVTIQFMNAGVEETSIQNVNILPIPDLPNFFAGIPHQTADNQWLQSIIS